LPGNAYQTNWNAFVFSLSIPFAALIAIIFFVPLYRKINSPSAYTYLEQRFGPWARIYVSICYLLTQLMRTGTILYLLALALNAVFGWDIVIIIVSTGILVMLYSLLGGLQAVVWTDAIQAIILISGALVCAVYILLKMPEGSGQLFSIAIENKKFSLGSFSLNLSESTFWVVLIYGIFINLQNYGIDQNYVQRYLSSRNDYEARRSAFLGGMLYIPVSFIFLFIGTALFSFYSSAAELPEALMDPVKSDRIFPYFIVTELPAGISGLLIASIFAAGMSTISTSFNSSATVFLTDYYRCYFKKEPSERESMKVLYLATFIIGILGIIIGIALINVKSALDAWWKLASIFSGGMLGLFLLGIIAKGKKAIGPVTGTIAGLLVIVWLSLGSLVFGKDIPGGHLHSYLTIVIGTATIFLTGFFIMSVTNNKPVGSIK
jgi:SSS family solute:Na+ symporter